MSAKSITRLYDNLTVSLGKENAENVTAYCDHKFSTEMENNLKILATKDDLRNEVSRLDNKITETKVDLITRIEETKTDLGARISETKVDFITKLEETKTELVAMISETKVDFMTKLGETKTDLISKIGDTNMNNIRWMVGICIALGLMIIGLYFKK